MASIIRGSGESSFSGSVSIGGTLTYEDVTSVDSVGVITARGGVHIVSAGASIYSPANNELALYTNGSEKVRITSAGNVGIGSTIPATSLDVAGSTHFASNVGIGTTSPSNLLHLVSSSPIIRLQDTDGGRAMISAPNGNLDFEVDSDNVASSSRFTFRIDDSEKARIDSSGRLLLNSGTDVRIELGTTGTTGTNDRNHLRGDGANLKYNTASGGIHVFEQNGSEAMRIDSSGRILVGTSTNTYNNAKVQIAGPDSSNYLSILNTTASDGDGLGYSILHFRRRQSGGEESSSANVVGSHDGTGDDQKGVLTFGTNDGNDSNSPTERMRIDSSGRLLVGTSSTLAGATDSLLQIRGNSSGTQFAGKVALAADVAAGSIISGTDLGAIYFGNVANGIGGLIECKGDAQWGTDDYPGRLVFSTTADGDPSPTERMRIDANGNIRLSRAGLTIYVRNSSISALIDSANLPVTLVACTTDGGTNIATTYWTQNYGANNVNGCLGAVTGTDNIVTPGTSVASGCTIYGFVGRL